MGRQSTTPAFASCGRWSQPKSGRSVGPNQIGVAFKPSLSPTFSAVTTLPSSYPGTDPPVHLASFPRKRPRLSRRLIMTQVRTPWRVCAHAWPQVPSGSRPEAGPHSRRPGIGIKPVCGQQRQGDPLDTEADACGVGNIAVRRLDPEPDPEKIDMIVGRGDGRRFGVRVYGADDLVLERLGALARGEHPSSSPEEGVVRDDRVDGEAKPGQQIGGPLEPEVAVGDGTIGVTQVHELVLAESLHSGGIEARFVAGAE